MKSNSEIIWKKTTTIHFISISIFFKVFKNLCLNENDETLFLKKCISIILGCKVAASILNRGAVLCH